MRILKVSQTFRVWNVFQEATVLDITIPGYERLQLAHLVLDYNGTLACDGELLPGVKERLNRLAERMQIHVLTADTLAMIRPPWPTFSSRSGSSRPMVRMWASSNTWNNWAPM